MEQPSSMWSRPAISAFSLQSTVLHTDTYRDEIDLSPAFKELTISQEMTWRRREQRVLEMEVLRGTFVSLPQEVLPWIKPTGFKGVRNEILDISCTANWVWMFASQYKNKLSLPTFSPSLLSLQSPSHGWVKVLETAEGFTCSGPGWDHSLEAGRPELALLPTPPGIKDPLISSPSSPPSPGLPLAHQGPHIPLPWEMWSSSCFCCLWLNVLPVCYFAGALHITDWSAPSAAHWVLMYQFLDISITVSGGTFLAFKAN